MKIAFLSRFYGKRYRGAETFVQELSQNLLRMGHQVNVYPDSSCIDGQPEIIVSTNGRWDVFSARVKSWKNKLKLVVPGQSGPGWDDRLNLYSFPDVFVGFTNYQCRWAKSVNLFVRVIKIPNGVDLLKFGSEVKPLDTNLPHPIILSVAALEPIKRQDLLIRAVAKTNLSLMLCGQGSEYEKLNDLGNEMLKGRFQIISLSYEQMPTIYTAADLFSFPTSPWESFGMAMVEAMASGLPVVATDDPIRREIVGPAGIFIDPTNTEAFAVAIKQAVDKNWGDIPRRQAAKYSWDKIALRYDKLFKELCSQ